MTKGLGVFKGKGVFNDRLRKGVFWEWRKEENLV